MIGRPAPARSLGLWLVAPFFYVAPLGLIAGGLLLAGAGDDSLIAVNLPRNVAIVHALLIGWVTTTMMGAIYQLGSVVLGGRLVSTKLLPIQLVIHVAAVSIFVWALLDWRLTWMGVGGSLLVLSFILFLVNAIGLVITATAWTLTRAYLAVSLGFLLAAFGLGITFVGTLEHLWFPVTMGRLSAHAHLGLVGWVALTLMGVSYQLVPMFNVIHGLGTRAGRVALIATTIGLIAFAATIATDPGPAVRIVAAALLAIGPLYWAADQLRYFVHRSRRNIDVQGRATLVSLGFLCAAVVLGLVAAVGGDLAGDTHPAHWLLAYGSAGIVGWAGIAIGGNSYKIVPFLIWFHRYGSQVGRRPVPLLADISSDRTATVVVGALGLSSFVLMAGCMFAEITVINVGGVLLALSGVAYLLSLVNMLMPKQPGRVPPVPGGVVPG